MSMTSVGVGMQDEPWTNRGAVQEASLDSGVMCSIQLDTGESISCLYC